jgi:RNA polymerase sigma-B factor
MADLADPAAAASRVVGDRDEDRRRAYVERRLFERRDADDRRARDELAERFLPLARSVARRYQHCGEAMDDLVQVASLALVKAIDRFDPNNGAAFGSYAVPTIAGELKRHFRDKSWSVRPPRGLQELTLRVEAAVTQLTQVHDRAPTVAELAAALDERDEQILEALQARGARGALSFDAPARGQDEGPTLQDTLAGDEDGYALAENRVVLEALLSNLPARSRDVLRLRFEQDLTQAEIGALHGVSQMQVSRLIRQAIGQLRHIADQEQMLADRQRIAP